MVRKLLGKDEVKFFLALIEHLNLERKNEKGETDGN